MKTTLIVKPVELVSGESVCLVEQSLGSATLNTISSVIINMLSLVSCLLSPAWVNLRITL